MATRTPAERVAADVHAEDRLHDDFDVDIHHGGRGSIACIDTDDYSVYVYAQNDVDQGELHAAMASTFLQLGLTIQWQGGDDR